MASIVSETSRNHGDDTPVPGRVSGLGGLREHRRPRPVVDRPANERFRDG
ncbi:hypothetical protein GCM10010429_29950 [Micromonospora olivasterospora]